MRGHCSADRPDSPRCPSLCVVEEEKAGKSDHDDCAWDMTNEDDERPFLERDRKNVLARTCVCTSLHAARGSDGSGVLRCIPRTLSTWPSRAEVGQGWFHSHPPGRPPGPSVRRSGQRCHGSALVAFGDVFETPLRCTVLCVDAEGLEQGDGDQFSPQRVRMSSFTSWRIRQGLSFASSLAVRPPLAAACRHSSSACE